MILITRQEGAFLSLETHNSCSENVQNDFIYVFKSAPAIYRHLS